MKNRFFVLAAVLMTVASGGVYAGAMTPPEVAEAFVGDSPVVDGRDAESDPRRGRRLEMMGEVLGLSDAQRAAVGELLADERETVRPLRQQLRELRRELREATFPGAFDESKVRTLAGRQAEVRTEMVVSRARVESRVYALLTPEQQALSEKLRPLLDGPRGHLRGGAGAR